MEKFITKFSAGLIALAIVAVAVPASTVFGASSYRIEAPSSVVVQVSPLIAETANHTAQDSASVAAIKTDANSIVMALVGATDNTEGYTNVRIQPTSVTGPGTVQLWINESSSGNWYNTVVTGWGPATGFPIAADYNGSVTVVAVADTAGTYTLNYSVVDVTSGNVVASGTSSLKAEVPVVVTAENFNTHKGSDYTGVNVGFNVSGVDSFSSVVVELYDESGKLLVSNEGNIEKLNALLSSGVNQLSTPFIVQNLTYGVEEYWTLGAWSSYNKPAKAVIVVNGLSVSNETLAEVDSWATIAPAVNPENFNTHNGGDYKGINVGFNVKNINAFSGVTIELQDENGNTLVKNEGNLALLNDLLSAGTNQFSTPFITDNLTYGEEAYWTLGKWISAAKPAKALITVNGITVVNENLSEQDEWSTIAPVIPVTPSTGGSRSGGSRTVADRNAGEVAGAQTGPAGEVLGASTVVFTRQLGVGANGTDVSALQSILIASGDLAIAAPTGYFGELTKAALAKWQARNGIPSTGYFGPLTMAAINAATTPAPVLTEAERAALLKELLEKVTELQKQLEKLQ